MRSLKCLIVLLLFPLFSFAWDSTGHSTCGAIAYYYLKANNPAAIQSAVAVLKNHPWYSLPIWTKRLARLKPDQQELGLFMLASTFPDDARDSVNYSDSLKKLWHYVDYPFVPEGQHVKGQPPLKPNAEDRLYELLKAIKREKNGKQKAIELCWLFHLIEDVHQPLHATMLFDDSKEHQHGDGGGNLTYFIKPGTTKAQKLHSYWDELIKGNFTTVSAIAQKLMQNPKYSEKSLTELTTDLTVRDWILKESYELAVSKTYLNGALKGTKTNPSKVPANYPSESLKVAERRVMLAGIRLAKKLVEVL